MTKSAKGKPCEKHLIEWNWKDSMVIDDDGQSVTFDGHCDRCGREFQVTFHEPRYSIMDIDSKGELTSEWENYEMIGTEVFAN